MVERYLYLSPVFNKPLTSVNSQTANRSLQTQITLNSDISLKSPPWELRRQKKSKDRPSRVSSRTLYQRTKELYLSVQQPSKQTTTVGMILPFSRPWLGSDSTTSPPVPPRPTLSNRLASSKMPYHAAPTTIRFSSSSPVSISYSVLQRPPSDSTKVSPLNKSKTTPCHTTTFPAFLLSFLATLKPL